MPQGKVTLPAPNGLDNELMELAIYKLAQLGTIEGGEIGAYIAERPDNIPESTCPKDTVFIEFRAQIIPDLRKR
ncbi:hypothetical protein PBI_IRONMAN_43 [Mycobacterium phage IronMan]|uniref:Uncharacterized protein n=1 Tax=Mycobacterium phage IronMan TaxID=2499042 RepID=A0A3S9UD66_9CAUD|nr:hypothetical protein KI247_gp58 [Mycobacterium phage IronMan]AZS08245.1 hypothetical protein PBI_IRONMAN_43 [Mycobacterium phage IronMan]